MSAIARQWIIVLSFFLFIAGSTVVEAVWLSRKGRASFGRSLGFSVLTNLIGCSIGFFVFFVIMVVIVMMIFDGSLENFPLKDYGLAATVIFTVLFIPAALTVCKRIFLSVFKIQTVKSVWLYSIVSSVLSLAVSLGAPLALSLSFFKI